MKIRKLPIIFALALLFIPTGVYGAAPSISENYTNEEAAVYNKEVEDYNKQIDKDYDAALQNYQTEIKEVEEHNKEEDQKVKEVEESNKEETARIDEEENERVEEAKLHNEEERKKVEENQQALEKQEKIKESIEKSSEKDLENTVIESEDLPTDYSNPQNTTYTILKEDSEESEETYKVINLHVFLKEGGEIYYGTIVNDEGFELDNSIESQMLLGEWETTTVKKNQTITLISLAEQYGSTTTSALFKKPIEGYVNGYWLPTNETVHLSDFTQDWGIGGIKNVLTNHSSNIFSLWTYTFIRVAAEPTLIDEYIPDYWDEEFNPDYSKGDFKSYEPDYWELPSKPTKGKYLQIVQLIEEPINNELLNKSEVVEETPTIAVIPLTSTARGPIRQSVAQSSSSIVSENQNEEVIEEITEEETPLTKGKEEEGYWALINFILLILTIFWSFIIMFKGFYEDHKRENYPFGEWFPLLVISIVTFTVAAIRFFTTEDMSLPMQLFDQYTIGMATTFVIQLILSIGLTIRAKDYKVKER